MEELLKVPEEYAISIDSIEQAALRIKGSAHKTPVLTCQSLNHLSKGLNLFFKCENLQKGGAFKFRGALNAVKAYAEENRDSDVDDGSKKRLTFITHSSGNHGQAVALAAKNANCDAIIVMPNNAPSVKQQAVISYEAKVILCEPTLGDRERTSERFVAKDRGIFIHPSNDLHVMSGQGTLALEMIRQVEVDMRSKLDAVLVPIGGGGLSSGTAMAVKSLRPQMKVYAVEPQSAADAHASFYSGELQTHQSTPVTVADGLKTTLGSNNWPIIRDLVDGVILVSDDEIINAMRLLWERMKMVVEPSGAVAAAAVISGKLQELDNAVIDVGIVISGGNVDLGCISKLLGFK